MNMNAAPPVPILLVEDDDVDVKMMRRLFERLKFKNPLHVVRNGQEALAYLHDSRAEDASRRPGLILLDLNMPIMNGLEFLRTLKANTCYHRIPVVIMTTSDDRREIDESFALGVAGYFVKSLDLQQFADMMTLISEYWRQSCLPEP